MTCGRITVLTAFAILCNVDLLGMNCCFAQQSPGGSRGNFQTRRPLFDSLREAYPQATYRDVLSLLHHSPIRAEIGMSDVAYEEFQLTEREAMSQISALDSQLPRNVLVDKILEILDQSGTKTFQKISVPHQERLLGIYVQERIARERVSDAAANQLIAEKIGLEEEELAEFRKRKRQLHEEMRETLRPEFERLYQNTAYDWDTKRQKMEKLFERGNQDIERKLDEKLSAEQRQKLLALQGAKFDDLPPVMGRGGRRGPPPNTRSGGPGNGHRGEHPDREERTENRSSTEIPSL